MRSVFLLSLFTLTGCASITDGTSQAIIFRLTPKEARCIAVRETVELGSFTGASSTLTVSKGARDIVVTCKANGFLDKQQRLVSSTQTAGVVGGIFLDLGVVDMLTGAMWKYPTEVSIMLDPDAPASAQATPVTQAAVPATPASGVPADAAAKN